MQPDLSDVADEKRWHVVLGAVLTLVILLSVPLEAFGTSFVLALLVAAIGRRMRWGARTALASTLASALPTVLTAVLAPELLFTIRGALYWLVPIPLTWLAWQGGLIVANRRGLEKRSSVQPSA